MKVYIELLFFDNLIMNLIILYFAGRFSNIKTGWLRLLSGAALGAVYALAMFIYGGVWSAFPVKIAVSLLMCFAAFYKKGRAKTYFKSMLYMYVLTFVMGGAAYAFLNFGEGGYIIKGGIITGSGALRYILSGILSAIVLSCLFKRIYKNVRYKSRLMYDIRIAFSGKEASCRAYLDTGNSLTEPISGLPAIIADIAAVKEILPQDMLAALTGGFDGRAKTGGKWFKRLRVIPCRNILNKKSVMLGFMPDSVKILDKDGEKDLRAVIAVTDGVLSGDNTYNALLSPEAFV